MGIAGPVYTLAALLLGISFASGVALYLRLRNQSVPPIPILELLLLGLVFGPILEESIELDAFTGLRRGELIGLRWEDVDFEQFVVHVRRSVVAMVEGAPKTEASQKDVPLDAQTA